MRTALITAARLVIEKLDSRTFAKQESELEARPVLSESGVGFASLIRLDKITSQEQPPWQITKGAQHGRNKF